MEEQIYGLHPGNALGLFSATSLPCLPAPIFWGNSLFLQLMGRHHTFTLHFPVVLLIVSPVLEMFRMRYAIHIILFIGTTTAVLPVAFLWLPGSPGNCDCRQLSTISAHVKTQSLLHP